MSHFFDRSMRVLPALALLLAVVITGGCATAKSARLLLPPVLSQDELLRPYQKLAVVEVHRERYGAVQDISPEDYGWAHQALGEEAARMGADAVIFPEVRVELNTYIFFPTSEITARGVAIKFR